MAATLIRRPIALADAVQCRGRGDVAFLLGERDGGEAFVIGKHDIGAGTVRRGGKSGDADEGGVAAPEAG